MIPGFKKSIREVCDDAARDVSRPITAADIERMWERLGRVRVPSTVEWLTVQDRRIAAMAAGLNKKPRRKRK